MLFQRIPELEKSFTREGFQIAEADYKAIKMKIGPGPQGYSIGSGGSGSRWTGYASEG
jgi:hypothetical protein